MTLVVEGTRFPAHSQLLCMQFAFFRRVIIDVGPVTPDKPLVVQEALQGHSCSTVQTVLSAVYSYGKLHLDCTTVAWQVCLLVDQLDCPDMLRQCKEYLEVGMKQAELSTSQDALEWITTADRLNLCPLKDLCAQRIAADFVRLTADPKLSQLSSHVLLSIMTQMSHMMSHPHSARAPGLLTSRIRLRLAECT